MLNAHLNNMNTTILLYGFSGFGRKSSVYYSINQIENYVSFFFFCH